MYAITKERADALTQTVYMDSKVEAEGVHRGWVRLVTSEGINAVVTLEEVKSNGDREWIETVTVVSRRGE